VWCAGCLGVDRVVLCGVQDDWVWIEPATNGEFDVAVGAQIRGMSGDNVSLIDDDQKVTVDDITRRIGKRVKDADT
jgi:hypothetical protein